MTHALNIRSHELSETIVELAEELNIQVHDVAGARVLDCGVQAAGGLHAGLFLSRLCLADLAEVTLVPLPSPGPSLGVQVQCDHPLAACLGSQYAGWPVKAEGFFGMGSGPMRAVLGREEVLKEYNLVEESQVAVGVLETSQLPTPAVLEYLADRLKVPAASITLAVAPAASLAGTIQVVARSLETALHKLHELKFDLRQIRTGHGIAPLPPVAKKEIAAIGRTNDAILYGGTVTLWVHCPDELLETVGPLVPSSASKDHGARFAELFQRYDGDFYKIDPMLFSPAVVVFHNLATGRSFRFGQHEPALIDASFFGA
ncbi:MAG: methenyltetrahydromethanopterin cyclohydrolase [Gemmataceae bacterium]